MAGLGISKALFDKAKRYIPGGVNSPVRSFKAVGGYPIFVREARGSRIYGECGRGFIDYCLSWGALILGHAHPKIVEALHKALKRGTSFGTATRLEIELARHIVEAVPSVEQVRLTTSGTEAVMSAIRLARAYTRKNKVIKFEGAYHGHVDYLLAGSGSGPATLSIPNSLGVPAEFTRHTIVLPYNDIGKVRETVKRYQDDLAAIIVEPVAANCGVIKPVSGFLEGLREISDEYGIVLIFDEVITGFRLAYGGAQEYFGVQSDLTCLGKIIGGGLPVGAFGGRKRIMKLLAPEGGVYQAGTFSGNPMAVTAGIVTLKILKEDNPYPTLEKNTRLLCEAVRIRAQKYKIGLEVNHIGSLFSLFFTNEKVKDYTSACSQNLVLFRNFYHNLLKNGIYLSPSGFEANFLSSMHTGRDIEKTVKAMDITLKNLVL
jgi:glutamate-1-semialdehyde 2,1-aminomutase